MHTDERGGLLAYRFDALSGGGVTCLVSSRLGGVSREPYTSLNVGLKVEDQEDAVARNRRTLFSTFGMELEQSVWCEQVHGDEIAVVTAQDAGRGAIDVETAVPGADALVTDAVGLALCVTVADCVPIAIYDPKTAVVGVAHAGWSGTVAKIAARTVETMRSRFGSAPSDLLAAIGPSIGPGRYEIGSDVIERVRDSFGERAEQLLTPVDDEKALLDLWGANRLALIDSGVAPTNIEVAGISTADRLEHFYSYRAEGKTGRFCAVIALSHR